MLTGNPIALIPRWGKALGEPRPAESVCSLVTTPFKLIYLKPFFPTLLAHSFCDPSHSMWSLSTNVLHLSVKCTAFLEHVPTTTEALDAEKAVPPQFCRRQTLIVFFFYQFSVFSCCKWKYFFHLSQSQSFCSWWSTWFEGKLWYGAPLEYFLFFFIFWVSSANLSGKCRSLGLAWTLPNKYRSVFNS